MFSRGHKCKHLFYLELLDDLVDLEEDGSLLSILVEGGPTLRLMGCVLDIELRILVDTRTTHNFIDLSTTNDMQLRLHHTLLSVTLASR